MSSASGEFSTVDDSTLISGDSIMGEAVGLARLGPGKTLGSYIVLARLGLGALGVLYTAYDPRNQRQVAIRLLRPSITTERSHSKRLLREARELAKVRHPHLVRIHEVGVVEEVVFVAMDLLDGGTLREWLDAEARDWHDALDMFRGVGSGLAAAHRAGIVHGDIRPSNVLLDDDGAARLVDFCLGREPPRSAAASSPSPRPGPSPPSEVDDITSADSLYSPLLRTGKRVGTPAYMAPEQYAGEPADTRSDQFSFCVMLYEALYGERPFGGRTVQGLFLAVKEGRLRPAPRHARVPRWIREIVVRGLAHDPAERWPSMNALLDALARDPSVRWRRYGTVAALTVALLAGALAVIDAHRTIPSPSADTEAAQARDALLDARALAHNDARADALLLDALTHATAAGDDALSLDIARELGVRIELRQVEALTSAGEFVEAREHHARARVLLDAQHRADPNLERALTRWAQTHP